MRRNSITSVYPASRVFSHQWSYSASALVKGLVIFSECNQSSRLIIWLKLLLVFVLRTSPRRYCRWLTPVEFDIVWPVHSLVILMTANRWIAFVIRKTGKTLKLSIWNRGRAQTHNRRRYIGNNNIEESFRHINRSLQLRYFFRLCRPGTRNSVKGSQLQYWYNAKRKRIVVQSIDFRFMIIRRVYFPDLWRNHSRDSLISVSP